MTKYFFYLPPGCFTSFELLSIICKPPADTNTTLQIQFRDQSIVAPNPETNEELLEWSTDLFSDFSLSRCSKFTLIVGEQKVPVDFDNLNLLSIAAKPIDASNIPNIFIFRFLSGYFVRKEDYQMKSLFLSPLRFISANRRENYQKCCQQYKQNLAAFEEGTQNGFQSLFDDHRKYDAMVHEKRLQIYNEYCEATKDTPVLHTSKEKESRSNPQQRDALHQSHISNFSPVIKIRSRSSQDLIDLHQQSTITKSEKKNFNIENKNENVNEQNENVNEQNENVNEQNEDMNEQNENVNEQNEDINDQNADMNEQNEDINDQNEDMNDQNEDMNDQNEDMNEQNEDINEQNEDINDQNEDMNDQNENMNEQNEDMNEQNEDINEQNEDINDQNEDMNEQNENENLQHSKIEYKNENDHERENYPSQSHRPIYSSKIQRRMTSGAADLRKRFGRVLPVNNARKTPEFFPPDRTGPRAPSKAEIKMFLEELTLIFPINLHAKTFCGVSVEENDSNCAKMLMFNIVHFLTLFSEFTGIVYDYRISIVDGWYKLEERLTGNEIKRDINSKNIQSNPYREAVISCLQKILYEFQLKPQSLEILDMLDAILKFHSLLT